MKNDFQRQLAGMKKLRDMLVKARRFADSLDQYVMGGKSSSVSGVEANIDASVTHLDRMIADIQRQTEKGDRR